MQFIKSGAILFTGVLVCLQTGCASVPVSLSAVGPNPYAPATPDSTGKLTVFSATEDHWEGDNTPWKQHTDYYIYDQQHKKLKHVYNTTGHYAEAPSVVALPPGQYTVKAHAATYFWVEVPVLVQKGKSTTVYLDDSWKPSADSPKTKLAYAPSGSVIGWRTEGNSQENAAKSAPQNAP